MNNKNFSARTQPTDCWNASLLRNALYTSGTDLPLFDTANAVPKGVVSFKNITPTTDRSQWIHFYECDKRLEVVWESPECFVECFRQFAGIISPDLSIFYDMPILLQGYNTLRNRTLAHWFSHQGIPVIPNIRWGDERSYAFCFDGIEQHKVVCISTYGFLLHKHDRSIFCQGLDKMITQLEPNTVLVYGQMPNDIFGPYMNSGVSFVHLCTDAQKSRMGGGA